MEIARDEWGLNDQLARSAAAAEEARRSKARSLRSESEAEGPEPSEKMVDELAEDGDDELEEGELEEGELPPTLQEDPIPAEREFPIPFPRPITDNAFLLLVLASVPVPPTPAAPPRPVEVVVEIVSTSFLSPLTRLILPMSSQTSPSKSKGKQPIRRAPTPPITTSDGEDSVVEVAPPPGPPDGRNIIEARHADLKDTLVSPLCPLSIPYV